MKMVRKFFHTCTLILGLNETNVVPILKKKNPKFITDLRPVSLCNVLVKVITKVIMNRMKGLLDEVVSQNQSAFITGRLILDNIMISYEVMPYFKKYNVGKRFIWRLKSICIRPMIG